MNPSADEVNLTPRLTFEPSFPSGRVGVATPKIEQGHGELTGRSVGPAVRPESSVARTWIAPGPFPVKIPE